MPGTPEDSALAFDVGTRVIGVAIGNRLSGSARALTTLAPDDWARLDALVAEWRPDALVVGLPLTLDGAEQPMSRRARAFATQLEQRYQRPTHLVDERNTSREAARRIAGMGVSAVLIKGGHYPSDDIVDLLLEHGEFVEFRHARVPGRHTHGTGCTFSAAITAQIALGRNLREAIPLAQGYVAAAIREAPDLGRGHGPMGHLAGLVRQEN